MLTFSRDYGTSAIRIDDDDDLYAQFITWVSAQRMTELSRDLKASSRKPRARCDDSDDEDSDSEPGFDDVVDESGIFNYDKWAGKNPIYYEPNLGDDEFKYNGTRFQFTKDTQENKYAQRVEYHLVIRCMGRSTQPIKDLVDHVRAWNSRKPVKTTDIYRPEGKYDPYWDRQVTRPSRPITTVTLDQEQKDKVVADVNEYLHPATARWYAARGIPHRRGYLFHGPPGTGKTSLSFAIAGIFGLSIYSASLSEPELTESQLATLFSRLPDRCVVLLEDIDSAGIRREGGAGGVETGLDSDTDNDDNDDEAEKPAKSEEKKDDVADLEQQKKKLSLRRRLTRSLRSQKINKTDSETTTLVSHDGVSVDHTTNTKSASKPKSSSDDDDDEGSKTKNKITLAGLLNIIDGAASTEGRVLIMTTNCPEKLDPALIRPGRVDVQIKFTLATRIQIQDIFRRMYSHETDLLLAAASAGGAAASSKPKPVEAAKALPPTTSSSSSSSSDAAKTGTTTNAETEKSPVKPFRPMFVTLPTEQLDNMAKAFAESLPENSFSPAEIQGYLLMRKADPQAALDGVAAWRDGVLEARRKGKKMLDVK